ncbi:MAG: SpoIIE family protein phosphatase [Kineosporiaceae bacterium]
MSADAGLACPWHPDPQDVAWLPVEEPTDVASVRRRAVALAADLGVGEQRTGELAIVATELASNVVKHSGGGLVAVRALRSADRAGVELVAVDAGPGIPDVALARRDGFSSAGMLGIGLGAVVRLADRAEIFSLPGRGTVVTASVGAEPSPDSASGPGVGCEGVDAFDLEDGSALLAIGDVQGHSLAAAMIMAELRYSVRAYAHDGHGPRAVMERLNRRLLREHPEWTATVCLVHVRPDRSGAVVVNAGHLPPVLARVGGETSFVVGHGPLLGLPAQPPLAVEVALAAGDRLVLVTDGLVERRDRPLEAGLDLLMHRIGAAADLGLDALADDLMAELGSAGEDDAALVAVEVTG